jgi:hypothetical protein
MNFDDAKWLKARTTVGGTTMLIKKKTKKRRLRGRMPAVPGLMKLTQNTMATKQQQYTNHDEGTRF